MGTGGQVTNASYLRLKNRSENQSDPDKEQSRQSYHSECDQRGRTGELIEEIPEWPAAALVRRFVHYRIVPEPASWFAEWRCQSSD